MSEHAPIGAHGGVEEEHDAVESNRLGMWIFLATEILLFGGLFCAYAVYRSNHPEIFIYAHQFLSKTLGGINTIVLIGSSFTMAWAVRSAQLGESRRLAILLAITLLCGFCFLGIKSIEYEAKWKHGLLWGQHYKPVAHEGAGAHEGAAAPAAQTPAAPTAAPPAAPTTAPTTPGTVGTMAPAAQTTTTTAAAPGAPAAQIAQATSAAPVVRDSTRSVLPLAAEGPRGLAAQAGRPAPRPGEEPETVPKNVQIFFSIYFAMTGLHALHVIVGMTLIGIMLRKALRGQIGPKHFTGVDSVGLYWHLVDVIWIYLFPLLYLIK
jgi:cytochrome c oxidase subunit 3